jgi:(p)ppGpp synthase/HD superfamily hydrolase
MFAQTNVQLFNQLVHAACPPDDMVLIRRAHDLAIRIFAGLYRPSGKSFMDHVVGTASIIHQARGKPVLTAAGLLHSAHSEGDFGFPGRLSMRFRNHRITNAVGDEVAAYVRMYDELAREPRDADRLLEQVDGMSQAWRDIAALRVANEIEDHLNGGTLYCHHAASHRQRLGERREVLAGLARRLELPALERAVDRVFDECARLTVAPELLQRAPRPRSYRLLPGSCRRSAWLFLYEETRRLQRWAAHG